MPVDEKMMVDLRERPVKTVWLPGTEEMPDRERYFVRVARFNLTGRGSYNYAVYFGEPGEIPLTQMLAGVIGFRLPGRDKDGKTVVLTSSTRESNQRVFEALSDDLASWILQQVRDLNPMETEGTEEEIGAAAAKLQAEKKELVELKSMEPEADPQDPTAPSAGSRESPSAAAETTPDASTPSKQPS